MNEYCLATSGNRSSLRGSEKEFGCNFGLGHPGNTHAECRQGSLEMQRTLLSGMGHDDLLWLVPLPNVCVFQFTLDQNSDILDNDIMSDCTILKWHSTLWCYLCVYISGNSHHDVLLLWRITPLYCSSPLLSAASRRSSRREDLLLLLLLRELWT